MPVFAWLGACQKKHGVTASPERPKTAAGRLGGLRFGHHRAPLSAPSVKQQVLSIATNGGWMHQT